LLSWALGCEARLCVRGVKLKTYPNSYLFSQTLISSFFSKNPSYSLFLDWRWLWSTCITSVGSLYTYTKQPLSVRTYLWHLCVTPRRTSPDHIVSVILFSDTKCHNHQKREKSTKQKMNDHLITRWKFDIFLLNSSFCFTEWKMRTISVTKKGLLLTLQV